jgi:DNA polymerase IIIc chi subunit
MKPEEVELRTTTRQFSYEKLARAVDLIDDKEVLKNLAKTYIKLYMKQQEVISKI